MKTAPSHRGRFAPSPTGPLHLGSLLAAMGSWWMARQAGGKWLVRIEDIDPLREIVGAATHQIETLKAFGMESDEAILRQSQRDERYRQVLQILADAGHAFECFCSRRDLIGHQGIHRFCIAQHAEKKPAIRLKIPELTIDFDDHIQGHYKQSLGTEVGDMVIKRADGFWAYQLAVVIDDADQEITHVVRGRDLLDSTPRQIYLQGILGFTTPQYSHLPLVTDDTGSKLSKSLLACPVDGDNPMPAMRRVWEYLGQDTRAWPQGSDPGRLLLQALTHFDARRIPSISQMPTT